MSETSILGFKINSSLLSEELGSGNTTLSSQIIAQQKDYLTDCNQRFDYYDRKTISAEDAVTAVIDGEISSDNAYECACVMQAVLKELAESLEDTSNTGSLNFNLDYWLDSFDEIFALLGLSILAEQWQKSSFPLMKDGEAEAWPILTLLDTDILQACKNEFESCNLDSKIETLDEELFTDKSEDANAEIMRQNIVCLQSWISNCLESNSELILIFDGDA